MPKFCVAANWKMNQNKKLILSFAQELGDPGSDVDVVIGTPTIYLDYAKEQTAGSQVTIAAQNAFFEDSGAFTGETSPAMLDDIGIKCVIIGHSERRQIFGEGNELIAKKLQALVSKGFRVIFCIGESLAERENGDTFKVIESQLQSALTGVSNLQYITIAYEPIWAIGTGVAATSEQAEECHKMIREWVAKNCDSDSAKQMQILYGGSVKPKNFAELLSQPNIDGGLVGGASLKVESFKELIDIAKNQAN